ncbi:ParA family protein [Massilia sp. R2A-15]|uniref:ParA family protein n=1 Tax=Massilia sp. R2A-15 TaxID=3064278 RepID=UPI0027325488|nr:ParA family protein [Massilia sp. R2A-15]WLI91088.1 ParA family protein [Massilia sp. R2A-15]
MKTMALANQKGGVGKSFVATQLAFFLAERGKRVLHLDLDHQRNSSVPLIKSGLARLAGCAASDVLQGPVTALIDFPFVVVSGDVRLSGLERQPEHHNSYVANLRGFLDAVGAQFDVCVIDTNPNPDIRYAAALICADCVLSPVQLNQEALDGIGSLLRHPRYGVHKVRDLMNPKLDLIGLLPNMVEATPFQRANLTQLLQAHPQLLISLPGELLRYAFIQTRTAIAEAQAAGVPLWQLRHASVSGQGKVGAGSLRTAAREAWREVRPVFEEIERRIFKEA